MRVYNHYPDKSITVSVELNNGTSKVLAHIEPKKSRDIHESNLWPGQDTYVRLNISMTHRGLTIPLVDVDVLPNQPEMHVGQVTTRVITHRWQQYAMSNNGLKSVRINNMTKQPITFGDNPADRFTVAPMSTVLYPGRERYGVPYGTVFIDADGLYPPFKIVRPITDIYYGIVTSIPQIPYGGDQAVFDERPMYSYPFETKYS